MVNPRKALYWAIAFTGLIVFCLWLIWDQPLFVWLRSVSYSKQDLIRNYNDKQAEIEEVRTVFKNLVPPDKNVFIEFEGEKALSIFHVGSCSPTNTGRDDNWDLDIEGEKTKELLRLLGWTSDTLKTLKTKLDLANCISLYKWCGEPSCIEVGYQRSGMGKYSYVLFDHALSEQEKKGYNDGCLFIYFREKVALEYGGGVFGPQCFEKD